MPTATKPKFDPCSAYVLVVPDPEFTGERMGVAITRGRARFVALAKSASKELIEDRTRVMQQLGEMQGYKIYKAEEAPEHQPPPPTTASFDTNDTGKEEPQEGSADLDGGDNTKS